MGVRTRISSKEMLNGYLPSELSINKSFFQELSKRHLSVKLPDLKIETWAVRYNPNSVSLKSGRHGPVPCKPWGTLSWSSHGSVSFTVERCMVDWQCHLVREGMILTLKAAVAHKLFCCFVFFYDRSPEILRALWMPSRHLKWQCLLIAEKKM